ncbi:MAG: PKD domain-containing protein [Anaerolineales bacterium]|nr:PKD domain-containing protein [Anaerolineales bacterium]
MIPPSQPTTQKSITVFAIVLLISASLLVQGAFAGSAVTERVSISSEGVEGDHDSIAPSVSADGRYIVFASKASNLIPDDLNSHQDIFLHDWATGITERISTGREGTDPNGSSAFPSISADGNFVVFSSAASNLVSGDTNGVEDVFLYDRTTGETERISLTASSGQSNGASYEPVVSEGGRYVAFVSMATNLYPGASHGVEEIYYFDRTNLKLRWLSGPSGLDPANDSSYELSMSADGAWVVFSSNKSNLVPNDTNGVRDIFLWNKALDSLERVNLSHAGLDANRSSYHPSVSDDGRFIAFRSFANNLILSQVENYSNDIFRRDRLSGSTERVNVPYDGEDIFGSNSGEPVISADGRFVAFRSDMSNLVTGDTNNSHDVFVRDMQGSVSRISESSSSVEASEGSFGPAINSGGSVVVFYSDAANLDLIREDNNGLRDVFSHGERPTPPPEPTETDTPEPTGTVTPEPTETVTPEPTETVMPEPTETVTPEPTETVTPEPTETVTPEPTDTVEPTDTPTPEPTATPVTPTPEPSDPPVIKIQGELSLTEGEKFELVGSFSDPDSNTWSASVDFGDGQDSRALEVSEAGKFAIAGVYGDNGEYELKVEIVDDTGSSGLASVSVIVGNQKPGISTAQLHTLEMCEAAGAELSDGKSTAACQVGDWMVARVGETTAFTFQLSDAGSDDLTVRWDFGSDVTYFNNGSSTDPLPSPLGDYPYTVTHTAEVVFDKPGVKHVRVTVLDDDDDQATVKLKVLVRNNQSCQASLGDWISYFMKKNRDAGLDGEIKAHLSILSGFISSAFDEMDPAAIDELEKFILDNPEQSARARAEMLTAWLNFVNGAVEWDDTIEKADGKHDLTYAEVLHRILSILLEDDPSSKQLQQAIQLARAINFSKTSAGVCRK